MLCLQGTAFGFQGRKTQGVLGPKSVRHATGPSETGWAPLGYDPESHGLSNPLKPLLPQALQTESSEVHPKVALEDPTVWCKTAGMPQGVAAKASLSIVPRRMNVPNHQLSVRKREIKNRVAERNLGLVNKEEGVEGVMSS